MKGRSIWVFCSAFLLYILFSHLFPVTDPVESNYALAAKEMITMSDWLSPHLYGKLWFDKPPMFYWLLALTYQFFGTSDWAARMVPAFFGAAGVWLIYWFVSKITGYREGFLAAAILGTCLQYFFIAKLLITDIVLFWFNSAALVFFYLGYTAADGTKKWYLLMYPCLALAVLTKGPVGLILPMLIILFFLVVRGECSEIRNMSLMTGTLLFSIVALPWYGAMYFKHGADFLLTFFGVHNYLRATVSEHPQDNVFYYYILVFLAGTIPWTGIAVGGLAGGYKRFRNCTASCFFMIWTAVYLVFYTLMATKYLTYTFPILFPVAILAAMFWTAAETEVAVNPVYWLMPPVIILLVAMLVAGHKYLMETELVVFAVASVMLCTIACAQIIRQTASRAFIAALSFTVAGYILLSAFAVPVAAKLRSGKELAEHIRTYRDYQIGFFKFYSTSFAYYNGAIPIRLTIANSVGQAPGVLSWSAKHTMPSSDLSSFVVQQETEKLLIIVPEDEKELFEQEISGTGCEIINRRNGFLIYRLNRSLQQYQGKDRYYEYSACGR